MNEGIKWDYELLSYFENRFDDWGEGVSWILFEMNPSTKWSPELAELVYSKSENHPMHTDGSFAKFLFNHLSLYDIQEIMYEEF